MDKRTRLVLFPFPGVGYCRTSLDTLLSSSVTSKKHKIGRLQFDNSFRNISISGLIGHIADRLSDGRCRGLAVAWIHFRWTLHDQNPIFAVGISVVTASSVVGTSRDENISSFGCHITISGISHTSIACTMASSSSPSWKTDLPFEFILSVIVSKFHFISGYNMEVFNAFKMAFLF